MKRRVLTAVAAALLSVLTLAVLTLALLALAVLALAVLAVPQALGAAMLRTATFLVTSIHRIHPFLQRFRRASLWQVQRHAVRPVPVASEALFGRQDSAPIAAKQERISVTLPRLSRGLWTAHAALL